MGQVLVSPEEFEMLSQHLGHELQFVGYGPGGQPRPNCCWRDRTWWGLAVECMDCGAVVVDWAIDEEMELAESDHVVAQED